MKKVVIRLEYKCFPMWVYDEDGILIANDLVEELSDNYEIDKMLTNIQVEFDNLYIDNKEKFEYRGFANEKGKDAFIGKINQAVKSIYKHLQSKYEFENMINEEML